VFEWLGRHSIISSAITPPSSQTFHQNQLATQQHGARCSVDRTRQHELSAPEAATIAAYSMAQDLSHPGDNPGKHQSNQIHRLQDNKLRYHDNHDGNHSDFEPDQPTRDLGWICINHWYGSCSSQSGIPDCERSGPQRAGTKRCLAPCSGRALYGCAVQC